MASSFAFIAIVVGLLFFALSALFTWYFYRKYRHSGSVTADTAENESKTIRILPSALIESEKSVLPLLKESLHFFLFFTLIVVLFSFALGFI